MSIPWLVYDAISYIDSIINDNYVMYEYGCGGSTLYYQNKVKVLNSVEHNKNWYTKTKKAINNNVNLNLCEVIERTDINLAKYADTILKTKTNYDIILIDGLHRNRCIKNAIRMLNENGYIILDNSNRKAYDKGKSLLNKWSRISFYGFGPHLNYRWETTIYKNDSKSYNIA